MDVSTFGPPAGWYPDATDASSVRWWDGHQWTANAQPAGGGFVAGVGVAGNGGPPTGDPMAAWAAHPGGRPPAGYGQPVGAPLLAARRSKGNNHYSLITFGVCLLYLALAYVTHFVLIGFIPLAMSMRAKRSGEPLAPVAVVAAIVVIVLSVFALFH